MMDIQPQIIRGTHNVTRRYVEPTAAMMAGCRRQFTHNAIVRTMPGCFDMSV